jgi:hypothetical protein
MGAVAWLRGTNDARHRRATGGGMTAVLPPSSSPWLRRSSSTEAIVTDDCPTGGYDAVPNQPATGPADLLSYLKAYCPRSAQNDTCLSSDPGNNFHNSSDEWQTLVGTTFLMPVMCGSPTCTELEYIAQGNTATYAIQRMATVELCGFRMLPKAASLYWPTTGPCATANPRHYTSNDVTSGAGLFLVIKDLVGGPTGDWSLEEYTGMRLTK